MCLKIYNKCYKNRNQIWSRFSTKILGINLFIYIKTMIIVEDYFLIWCFNSKIYIPSNHFDIKLCENEIKITIFVTWNVN